MSTLIDDGNESLLSSNSEAENSKPQLVGPLIGKLPSTVQGRILKTAGEIMEKGKWWKNHENSRYLIILILFLKLVGEFSSLFYIHLLG